MPCFPGSLRIHPFFYSIPVKGTGRITIHALHDKKAVAAHRFTHANTVVKRQATSCTFDLVLEAFKRLINPGRTTGTTGLPFYPAFDFIH